ncbi:MAG: LysM peptidoglycan-binding domain-containing protein [Phycisphaerae bacterium]
MAFGAKRRPANGIHTVVPGDTVSSVAATYGFTDWEAKVWNAAENAELKAERPNPNTLVPGDEIFIPELTEKKEARPVDAWHQFHVVRNKRFLRLKMQNTDGTPIAGKAYTITPRDGFRGTFVQQNQTTGADGLIEEEIPHTMTDATLLLTESNQRIKLQIGHLLPLPATEPKKSAGDIMGDLAGSLTGAAEGLIGGAGGIAGGLVGAAKGAVSGAASGSLSGGLSGSVGGGSASLGGGFTASASGAMKAAGDLAAQGQAAASGMKKLLASASTVAGSAVKAAAGALGDLAFPDETNPNIWPSAQRLISMGFDPGLPKDNKRTTAFTAALMEFQTWCKEQGNLASDAGGPLGELTSPGGMLGGGGGPLGDIAAAVAGPVLAAVGLTGQLDEETVEAIKKTHGC